MKPSAVTGTNPIKPISHPDGLELHTVLCSTGLTTRINALAAAATWLRYVADCSKLSLVRWPAPQKEFSDTPSGFYGSRALRQAELQHCT